MVLLSYEIDKINKIFEVNVYNGTRVSNYLLYVSSPPDTLDECFSDYLNSSLKIL